MKPIVQSFKFWLKVFGLVLILANIVVGVSLFSSWPVPATAATAVEATPTSAVLAQNSMKNDIEVDPVPSPSLDKKITSRAKSSWPGYITRASGLIALDLLIVLILSGVGLISGYTYKFIEPLIAWATHRALGLAFGVTLLIHIYSVLWDRVSSYTVIQILLPFAASKKPAVIGGLKIRSFYLALGIVAFYMIIAIILSSLFWSVKKPRVWKTIHFLSYLVGVFVFIHALYLGTDLSHGFVRRLFELAAVVLVGTVVYRLYRAGTI